MTMIPSATNSVPDAPDGFSELLLLPDGRVLVHNLTPAAARLLAPLCAADKDLLSRIANAELPKDELPD